MARMTNAEVVLIILGLMFRERHCHTNMKFDGRYPDVWDGAWVVIMLDASGITDIVESEPRLRWAVCRAEFTVAAAFMPKIPST